MLFGLPVPVPVVPEAVDGPGCSVTRSKSKSFCTGNCGSLLFAKPSTTASPASCVDEYRATSGAALANERSLVSARDRFLITICFAFALLSAPHEPPTPPPHPLRRVMPARRATVPVFLTTHS